MGVATKYAKDKGQDPEVQFRALLPFEKEFYESLSPRVLIQFGKCEPELASSIKELWEVVCVAKGDPARFLHEQYRLVYSNEAFVEDKRSNIVAMRASVGLRETVCVKLVERACSHSKGAAFVVYDYSWQYIASGQHLLVEKGVGTQTWVQEHGKWCLLGERVEQVSVENAGE
jgi:hypothetical protein